MKKIITLILVGLYGTVDRHLFSRWHRRIVMYPIQEKIRRFSYSFIQGK